MIDFITRRLAGLLRLLIFLRASQRSGPRIRGSQRGRRVISKLKRSGSKGVTRRRISVTSRYNVAHNWLGCCPDCVFISLASHTRGCISEAGTDDLHVFGAAAHRCWWWRLHQPSSRWFISTWSVPRYVKSIKFEMIYDHEKFISSTLAQSSVDLFAKRRFLMCSG